MNKALRLPLVAAALLLFAVFNLHSQTCTGNLLTNPGFEGNLNGWTVVGPASLTADEHSGSFAADLTSASFGSIGQVLPATPGTSYTMSAWTKYTCSVELRFLNSSWSKLPGSKEQQSVSVAYQQTTLIGTAPAGTAYVYVFFAKDGNGSFQVDDVCLTVGGTPACAITPTVTNIICGNNSTPADPNDDYYSFTVNATNPASGTGYQLTIPYLGQIYNGTYGSPLSIQYAPITAGTLSLIFTDNMTANCSATYNLTPPPPCSTPGLPDLSGSIQEIIPGTNNCFTSPGQSFGFMSMMIRNMGDVAATAFKVKFYFSTDNVQSANDVLWSTVNVPSLNIMSNGGPAFISPGQPVPASLAMGQYYVLVVIDTDNQVAESNEADNIIQPFTVQIGAPDVMLDSYSGIPATVAAGSSFPLQVTVKYLANGFNLPPNTSFPVEVAILASGSNIALGTVNYTLGDFSQANTVTKTVQVNVPSSVPTGTQTIRMNANTGFCEPVFPSNFKDQVVTITTGGSSQIDLELSMAQNSANPVIYSNYTTTLTLVNKGPQAATGVKVKWLKPAGVVYTGGNEFVASQGSFNPNGDQIWTVGSVPANGTATLRVSYFLLQNGAPITYAQVFAANETDVDSQPNNGTSPTPNQDDEASSGGSAPPVLTPDLRVTSLVLNQTTLHQGQVLTYNFRAENLGNGSVPGDFTIKSYISTDNQLSSNDVQDGTILTGNYPAGTDIPNIPGASTIPTNLPPGAYFLLVKIDGDNIVAEVLEGNNVAIMPFNVVSAPSGNCETPIGPGQFTCATQGSGGQVQVLLGQTSTSPYQYALYTLDEDGNTLGIQPNVLVPDPVNFTVSSSVLRKYNSLSNTEIYNKPIPASLWNRYANFNAAAEFGNGYILFAYKNQNLAQLDSLFAIRTDADLNPIAEKYLLPGNHISYTGVGSALQIGPDRLAFMYRFGAYFGNESIDLVVLDGNLNIKSNTQWLPSGVFSQGARLQRSICDNGFVISNNITLGFCNHGACYVAAQYFGDFQNDQFVTFSSGSAGEQSVYGMGTRADYWTVRTADNGIISASHIQSIPLYSFPLNDTITLTKTLNGATLWTRKVVVPGAANVKAIRELDGDVVFIKSNPTPNASSFVNEACLGSGTPPPPPVGCNAITITPAAGQITIAGATAPHVLIKVFRPNWTVAFECLDNCASPLTVTGLTNGTYHVQVKLIDNSWGTICYLERDVALNSFGGGNGSSIAKQDDRLSLTFEKVYPNPSSYQVFLDLFSPTEQAATLDFYDMQGRFVHTMDVQLDKGVNTVDVMVYDWKSGSYNVIARGEESALPAYGRLMKVWEE